MPSKNICFNYLITVHNKENLIRDVILGVLNAAGPCSTIYPILDGCTDLSEYIIDELICANPDRKIVKLFADDVHELKAINVGLRSADQAAEGYNIILQDDVILQDAELEKKCLLLYQSFDHLGILSFRHGANISRTQIHDERIFMPTKNYIQNQCGHHIDYQKILRNGLFTFRELAMKSPICIPCKIIREQGIPDEVYAPWDDLAYCYRISQAGYANAVFALNFSSEIDWGSTRTKKQKTDPGKVMIANLKTFKSRHPNIPPLDQKKYDNRIYKAWEEQL